MAPKTIKYEPFKRGDTPVFEFIFNTPTEEYDWSNVVLDAAMTNSDSPTDNSSAAVARVNQSLAVDLDGSSARYELQPTPEESKAFVPGKYRIEVQLKDNGGMNVATPLTGEVAIIQDYVI